MSINLYEFLQPVEFLLYTNRAAEKNGFFVRDLFE